MRLPRFFRTAVAWLAARALEQPSDGGGAAAEVTARPVDSAVLPLPDASHVFGTGRDVFVRVINGKLPQWQEASADSVDALLKSHFTDSRGVSIFRVDTDIDECEVAAAVKLGSGGLPKDAAVVRLPRELLDALSIEPDPTPGDTGVGPVDRRHHDLADEPDRLRELVAKLLELQLEGRDLIRQTRRPVLDRQLQGFLNLGDEDLAADSRQRCRAELAKRP